MEEQAISIRTKMLNNHLTYVWLMDQLRKKKGIRCRTDIFCRYLNGNFTEGGKKVIAAALEILEDYEKKMN